MVEVKDAIKGDPVGVCPNCSAVGVRTTMVLGPEVGLYEDLVVPMECVECNHKYNMHFIFKGNV